MSPTIRQHIALSAQTNKTHTNGHMQKMGTCITWGTDTTPCTACLHDGTHPLAPLWQRHAPRAHHCKIGRKLLASRGRQRARVVRHVVLEAAPLDELEMGAVAGAELDRRLARVDVASLDAAL